MTLSNIMYTKAPKRYRDADIAAMQGYRFNPYKEALLNPISGPLVGIPAIVPINTLRVRVKTQTRFSTTTGYATIIANPFAALCNDGVPVGPILPNTNGTPLSFTGNAQIATVGPAGGIGSALSNAPFTRAQFSGVTSNPSVRGRVVSACLRICNISKAHDKNGTFAVFTDPQHNTLQGITAATISLRNENRMYNADSSDWYTTLYHPVEPEEADGWVWDPANGPQGGTRPLAQNPGGTGDGGPTDLQPGFMGIWWEGAAITEQTFLVELYVIAEYVGSLVTTAVTENEANYEDAQEARHAAENLRTFASSSSMGDHHTGHPHSATRTK